MPFGTSTANSGERKYEVHLNHTSISGAGDWHCFLAYGEMAEETNTDQCVQDFIDMVEASDDFMVVLAKKSVPTEQPISPSE